MKQRPSAQVLSRVTRWRWLVGLAAGCWVAVVPVATESAIANGDTRTLSLVHAHTHETITATFLVNGQYDQAVLDKLNWFLRDWRRDEPTHMDPRLFDVVWEVYRESGSQQPIMVMSAYRSPETNAMLRRRSRQVAEHSQHILGRAMDQHYMDVPMSRIRELGMKLQRGGVGFYPTAGTPFVHLDVGGVRSWPRMSYDQLARLFPDGKTVHLPANGQPLPGYEQARAELEARGDGSYPTATQLKSKGFFAWLFGGGGVDEDDDNASAGVRSARGSQTRMASNAGGAVEAGGYGKSAADRGAGGGFLPQPTRSLFAAPSVPPPSPAPVAAAKPQPLPEPETPSEPVSQPVPSTAVALAEAPKTAAAPKEDAAALSDTSPIRNIPVANLAVMPLPPRRPMSLASDEPGAPLPPLRPADLTPPPHDSARGAKPDAIAAMIAGTHVGALPDVITQGSARSPHVLGYAAMAVLTDPVRGAGVPLPVARPAALLLSTHLDRSNFRTLTRPEATDRPAARSALGAAIPPLRAGSRADLGALVPALSARATTFLPHASDLSTDRFSGTVVKPTARAASGPAHTELE